MTGVSAEEVTQHPKWTGGDFEIVSSDNVKFCVPSLLLLSIS